MLRLLAALAGICSLYLAVIPLLSGFPAAYLLWSEVLLWGATVCLLAAGLLHLERAAHILALLGSGLIIVGFTCSQVAFYLARRGHIHFEAHIFAKPENWFDRWRLVLDRPVYNLLLALSVACFLLALRRWHGLKRTGNHLGNPGTGAPTSG